MTYVARTYEVRHDGLGTDVVMTTLKTGEALINGALIDVLPDGTIRLGGPSVVAHPDGTITIEN